MNPGRCPLLIAASLFASGIALGRWLSPPGGLITLFSLGCFLICLVSCRRPEFFTPAALIFFLVLGSLWWAGSRTLAADDITRGITLAAGRFVILKGRVISEPRNTGKTFSFILRAEEVETGARAGSCSGKILVFSAANVSLGDRVKIHCGLKELPRSRRRWSPFDLNLIASPVMKVIILKPAQGLLGPISGLKKRMLASLSLNVSPQAKGLLGAMVLGEKEGVPHQVYEAMVKTGTVHILVVSGFNVGVVSASLLLLLRLLRLPLRVRIIVALAGVFFYCLLTGASTPVVRATIVASVFLCGHSLKREPDINNSVGLAGLAVLSAWPEQLFDIGFQLSFSSVLAIVWIYPGLKKRLGLESFRPQILRVICEGGVVSFCAWCGTAGIIACNFGLFSPVTVIANLFIVPLASFITLTGFCSLASACFSPGLTAVFGCTAEAMLKLLLSINALMLKLPAASFDLRSG